MIVLVVGGATLAALLALLAVPIELTFAVDTARGERHVAARWLFGLVRAETSSREAARPTGAMTAKRAPTRWSRRGVAALRTPGFVRRTMRLVRDLWRAVRSDELRVHARIGLSDPADTGRLWGVLDPLARHIGRRRGVEVKVTPSFPDAAAEAEADGRLTVVPLRVLALLLGFALSPATLRALAAATFPDHERAQRRVVGHPASSG